MAVVSAPEQDAAAPGKSLLASLDGDDQRFRLPRLAPVDVFLQRRGRTALLCLERGGFDPPRQWTPPHWVLLGNRLRVERAGGAADDVGRRCSRCAAFGAEKRVVGFPVVTPFLHRAPELPGAVSVPMQAFAEVLRVGVEARAGGRRRNEAAAGVLLADDLVQLRNEGMGRRQRDAVAVHFVVELVSAAPEQQARVMLPPLDERREDVRDFPNARLVIRRDILDA